MSPEIRTEHQTHTEYRHVPEAMRREGMEREYSGKAVASLVLGIGGFLVPLIPSILAVIFGHSARSDLKMDHTQRGDGLALTGLILGWVGIGLSAVGLIAAAFLL